MRGIFKLERWRFFEEKNRLDVMKGLRRVIQWYGEWSRGNFVNEVECQSCDGFCAFFKGC